MRVRVNPAPTPPAILPRRPWRPALFFCGLLLSACAASGFADGVIFLVTLNRERGEMVLEPIVQIQQGKLVAPPTDPDFVREYLRRTYRLYQQGQAIGQVDAQGVLPFSCSSGLLGAARVRTTRAPITTGFSSEGSVYLLASSEPLPASPSAPVPLKFEERELARSVTLDLLSQLGLSAAYLEAATLTDAARLNLGEKPGLAGTLTVLADSESNPGATAFVLMERTGKQWQVVYSTRGRFKDIYGRDFTGRVFREAADFDHDGVPELILEVTGYEVYKYEVLKREGEQWQVIYSGGGGGC